MDIGALIGVVGGTVGILGAVVAYTRFAAQAPLQARVAELEAEVRRLRERSADLDSGHRAEVDREKERFAELEALYDNLRRDFSNLKRGKSGVVLKSDIDAQLQRGMKLLQAAESSVLVPGPPPSSSFVFLSIFGSAAAKLRYSKLPIDKGKAGKVFATGRLDNSDDPRQDSEFFEGMDEKGAHTTRTMVTVPLRHNGRIVGIVQFLNKANQRAFSRQDELTAGEIADELAGKVAGFTAETSNFELLGLSGEQEGKEETVLFCDLSASATFFQVLAAPDAIDCINEYFERQSEIAIVHGATVDKYIGDGIMLRFRPRDEHDGEHAARAVLAAFEMKDDFQALKQAWLNFDYAVDDVHSRVGIASGLLYESILGHRQHQHITVIGDTVNTAANLCDVASREDEVVLINARARELIGGDFSVHELPQQVSARVKSGSGPFYEVDHATSSTSELAM